MATKEKNKKENENKVSIEKVDLKICGISIYRILGYFIIYSFLGYLLETAFALIVYGKFESRQGFLYGPFCSIYGLGAAVMILALQRLKDKKHRLFFGGMIVGSIVEYLISLFGEVVMNVRWWDYSNKFFNINGRICLLYSIYWGIVSVYLMKALNPIIDKIIDFIIKIIKPKILKIFVIAMTIFLFWDCVDSAFAINTFLAKTVMEYNVEVDNKETFEKTYNWIYENKFRKIYADKFWNPKKMIRTYPNLRLSGKDGKIIYVSEYYPEIQPYYYKFEKTLMKDEAPN